MSDCCKSPVQPEKADLAICKDCGQKGRAVQRITPESLLLEDRNARLGPSQYYFCSSATCGVVYFSNEDGIYFHKADLRVRVGQKETEDPIPVCYCFGHTRASVWEEIRTAGQSTVGTGIAKLSPGATCSTRL